MGAQTVYSEHTVDSNGELFTKRWITRKVSDTEMFVRAYVEDLGVLLKCSGAERSVVLSILKYLDYGTNQFYLDSLRREEISKEAGITKNTLNTSVSRLTKKEIFIKHSSCAYTLNPSLFFFGSDMDRVKVFELTVRYVVGQDVEVKKPSKGKAKR